MASGELTGVEEAQWAQETSLDEATWSSFREGIQGPWLQKVSQTNQAEKYLPFCMALHGHCASTQYMSIKTQVLGLFCPYSNTD